MFSILRGGIESSGSISIGSCNKVIMFVSLCTKTVFLVIVKLLSKEKRSFVYSLMKLLSASRVCVYILKELGVFIL